MVEELGAADPRILLEGAMKANASSGAQSGAPGLSSGGGAPAAPGTRKPGQHACPDPPFCAFFVSCAFLVSFLPSLFS